MHQECNKIRSTIVPGGVLAASCCIAFDIGDITIDFVLEVSSWRMTACKKHFCVGDTSNSCKLRAGCELLTYTDGLNQCYCRSL